MKSIKRPLSLLLCAALVLGLLAGCGEQVETTPSSAQTEGPTTQATAEPTTEPVEALRTEHQEQRNPDGYLVRSTDSVYDSQDRLVEETIQFYYNDYSQKNFIPSDYSETPVYRNDLFCTNHTVYSEQGTLLEETLTVYFSNGRELASQQRTFDADGNVINETLSSKSDEYSFYSCNWEEIEAYLQSVPYGEKILASLLSGTQEISLIYLSAIPSEQSLSIYEYDPEGNLTWHTYNKNTSQDVGFEDERITSYNAEGKLTKDVYERLQADGTRTAVTDSFDSNGQLERRLSVDYQSDGQINSSGVVLYTYDELGLLAGELYLRKRSYEEQISANLDMHIYNDKGWLEIQNLCYTDIVYTGELSYVELFQSIQIADVIDFFTEDTYDSYYIYTYDENGKQTGREHFSYD